MKEKNIYLNLFFNGVKTLMGIIFSLLSFPYASRVLGIANIGLVQYYNSIINYFSLIASLGITSYAVSEGAKYRDDKEKLNKFSNEILFINIISMLVVYILLGVFLVFMSQNFNVLLILICSLLIMLQTLSIEWLYQIKEDYVYISIRSVLFQFISVICLYLFVKNKEDYYIYALITVFASGGSSILNLWNSKKYITLFRFNNMIPSKHIKSVFLIFGTSLASSIYMNLNNVMLGALSGTYAVGLYTVAIKINQIVRTLITSITSVLFPRISSLVSKGSIKEYKSLVNNAMSLILMITIPCTVGLICISEKLIVIFSGSEYLSATLSAQILAINLMISIIDGMLYYQVLLPHSMENQACIATIMGAITALIINFSLIPKFSYNGAAISTLLSEGVVFLTLGFFSKKNIDFKLLIKTIVHYILASLPIVFIVTIVNLIFHSYANIIISIPLSILVYFAILFLLKDHFFVEILHKLKNWKLNRVENVK